jgi:flagellar motility protein MotE (MotC chaperone)
MKLLASRWFLALLAILIHAGTSTVLVVKHLTATAEPPPPPTERPPRLWSFKTQAVDDLIAELQTSRKDTTDEHKSLESLRAQLASERAEVEQVREDIKKLRDALDERVLQIEEAEIKNLKTLATTYSTMKPAAAVAILVEMDENMAARILALMKPDKISAILEEMSKLREKSGEEAMARRAVRLSDKLRLLQPLKKEPS